MTRMVKRYARGKFSAYDEKFDYLASTSGILNAGAPIAPSISTIFWDKTNIKSEILKYTGGEGGFYQVGRELKIAILPSIKDRLKALHNEFVEYNLNRIKQGFLRSTGYPTALMDKKHVLEAEQDIAITEKETLDIWLKEIIGKEEDAREVCKFGLLQHICLRDGQIETIDNQKVIYINEIPVIKDEKSPYSGMAVSDYRELANHWFGKRQSAEEEKFIRLQQEYKDSGRPVPRMMKVSSLKAVEKTSLPKWPEGVKNYFVEELKKSLP